MSGKYTLAEILVALTVLARLSGCVVKETTPTTALVDPKARWLAGEPCRPPCWENIQPGVTRSGEAANLLKAVPSINPAGVEVQELPEGGVGGIVWMFSPNATSGNGMLSYQLEDNSVYLISLEIPHLCLDEIIDAYGEPDYLPILAYEELGILDLIWESHEFAYSVKLNSPGERISADICDGTLTQFPTGTPFQEMTIFVLPGQADDAFARWTGYGSYGSK